MPVQTIIKLRRDTAANWLSTNPTLAAGEQGYESNTGLSKIGDGATAWDALPYNAVSKIAEEVKNQTGATIAKGSVVYISGATGDNALISLSDADTEATSSKTLGLTAASIANGATGMVICEGLISGVNTGSATAGQSVWLSSTAGGFVFNTPPASPAHSVYLGVVIRAHAVNGEILIKVQNGYELDELHNVTAPSPADNDVLAWDSASSMWTNQTASGAGLAALVSPSFTTPSLGVATATSINGTTIPTSATLVTTAAGTATAATTAATATNIAGGIASQIPYQTGAGATSFIANGTAGQVLTSNGTSAPAFATPAGGGGLTLISTTTTANGATSATLSSIPQTYKALKLVIWYTGSMSNPTGTNMTFNGVATSYYYATSYAATSGSSIGTTMSANTGFSQTSIALPAVTANSPITINIENYTSATLTKSMNYFSFLQFMSSGMYFGAATNGAAGGSQSATTTIGLTFAPGASAAANIQLYGVN